MNEFENIQKPKSLCISEEKQVQGIKKLLIGIFMIGQIWLVLHFFFGMTSFLGRTVTPLRAVGLVVSVFQTSFFFQGLIGSVVGILYVVCAIVIIRNLVQSLPILKSVWGRERDQKATDALVELMDRFGTTFYAIIGFLMLVRLADSSALPALTVFSLVLCSLLYLASRFLLGLWEDGDVLASAYRVGCHAIYWAALSLLAIYLCRVNLQFFADGAVYAWRLIGTGVESYVLLEALFSKLVEPVFYIVLQIMVWKLMGWSLRLFEYNGDVRHKNWSKKLLIGTIVLMGIGVLISALKNSYSVYSVEALFFSEKSTLIDSVKNYFSMIFSAIGVYLAFYSPKKETVDPPAAESIKPIFHDHEN